MKADDRILPLEGIDDPFGFNLIILRGPFLYSDKWHIGKKPSKHIMQGVSRPPGVLTAARDVSPPADLETPPPLPRNAANGERRVVLL